MRFLNQRVIASIDPTHILGAVRQAYTHVLNDSYNMPDRMHVADNEHVLLLMPCFSDNYFATKLVWVFPDAPDHGFPAVNGLVALADNKTGAPLAVMNGAALTAARTGAVGGLGVSCLTSADVRSAGILGAGAQGLSQARYLLFNRDVKTLWVGDMNPSAAEKMIRTLESEHPDVTYRIPGTAEELVAESQVIITATTSKNPLFEAGAEQVKGKTFISIGSFRPDMKEFPDAVIQTADRVFVDTPFAAKESGDICIPLEKGIVGEEKIESFAGLLQAPLPPNAVTGATYLFKSVGMALFDLTVAAALFEIAEKNDLGQVLEL